MSDRDRDRARDRDRDRKKQKRNRRETDGTQERQRDRRETERTGERRGDIPIFVPMHLGWYEEGHVSQQISSPPSSQTYPSTHACDTQPWR